MMLAHDFHKHKQQDNISTIVAKVWQAAAEGRSVHRSQRAMGIDCTVPDCDDRVITNYTAHAVVVH